MRAAIYARKSTDNEAGVARQIEIARDFATKQGWTVDDAHVFSDNDVSGATHDRPGLNALLAAVDAPRRPFSVLVVMNGDRLSRGTIAESLGLQALIIDAGVTIWKYQDGTKITLESATDELKASIDAFSARSYREEISKKVQSAMRKLAEQGYCIGTAPFGYSSVAAGTPRCWGLLVVAMLFRTRGPVGSHPGAGSIDGLGYLAPADADQG